MADTEREREEESSRSQVRCIERISSPRVLLPILRNGTSEYPRLSEECEKEGRDEATQRGMEERQSGSLDRQIIRTEPKTKVPCKTRKKQSSSRLKLSEKSTEHVVPETMWKPCGSNNKNNKKYLARLGRNSPVLV